MSLNKINRKVQRTIANRYGYVYLTVFTRPTDRTKVFYVGQHKRSTVNPKYFGSGKLLERFKSKYGQDGTMRSELLSWAWSQEELDFVETMLIIMAKKIYRGRCINLMGGGSKGGQSQATIEKIRASRLGKPRGPMSDAQKAKLSLALIGRPKSEEHKTRIGLGGKGKIISEDQRAKISKAKTGVKKGPMPQEHKDSIRYALMGLPKSEEHRASLRKAASDYYESKRKCL